MILRRPLSRLIIALAIPCWGSAQAPTKLLTLRPELRLSAEEHNLSRIGGVVIGPNGLVVVNQFQDHQFRLFSATGAPLATVGRKGGGPGEFQSVGTSFWKGDTLWVLDATLGRMSAFDRAGKYLLAVPAPVLFGAGIAATDGRHFTLPSFISRNDDGSVGVRASLRDTTTGQSSSWLLTLRADGTLKQVGARLPGRKCTQDVGNAEIAIPFCPNVLVASSPVARRVVSVETTMDGTRPAKVRLTARPVAGPPDYVRDLVVPVTPLSATDIDRIRRPDSLTPPNVVAFYRRVPLPDARPPFRALKVGPDGSVWLSDERLVEGHYSWQGFDAKGAAIGVIRVRDGDQLAWASATTVWIVEVDGDGLETLVRHRIVR